MPSRVTRRASLVEHDRPDDELGLRPARGHPATTERPQPGGQLLVGERLDEVVVGTGVEPGHPVADGVAGGEHQDRDLGAGRPDAPGDLEAGDVGQADVEDDDLDAGRRLGDVEAVEPGRRGLDDVAVLLEESPQQADQPRVVLDDEQMHEVSLPLRHGMTVMLPAVPIGPVGAPLAPGRKPPLPPPRPVDLDLRRSCRR